MVNVLNPFKKQIGNLEKILWMLLFYDLHYLKVKKIEDLLIFWHVFVLLIARKIVFENLPDFTDFLFDRYIFTAQMSPKISAHSIPPDNWVQSLWRTERQTNLWHSIWVCMFLVFLSTSLLTSPVGRWISTITFPILSWK